MQNKTAGMLADENIGRLLFKLALPSFFGMLVMTLYNVVDTIFVGHYVSPLAIAGLSIAYPVQMLAGALSWMTNMGGASVISRLIGANDVTRAEKTLGNTLAGSFILTLIMAIIGLSNVDGWLRLIGASEAILPYARDFLSIILIGVVFQNLSFTFNGLTRSEGNANVSMIGQIIGSVLNIILCAIFIIWLHMGVKGSAWATVIAEFISCLYYVRYYLWGKSYLKIHLRNLIPNMGILKPVLAIGVSSLAMNLASSATSMIVNRVVIIYGGDYALSTYGIINRIGMFTTMPGMVIGMGLQPIIGYNYGARRYALVLRALKLALISSMGLGLLAFVLVYFFPQVFIGIFTTDTTVMEIGIHASHIIYLSLFIVSFAFIGPSVFQAIGKVVQSIITSLTRSVIFLIPLILILPRFWQLDGVWWAFALSDFLTVVLTAIMLVPLIREFRKGDKVASVPVRDSPAI